MTTVYRKLKCPVNILSIFSCEQFDYLIKDAMQILKYGELKFYELGNHINLYFRLMASGKFETNAIYIFRLMAWGITHKQTDVTTLDQK